MFLTVQGEGANAGRRAVFVRLAGCNLWSGKRPTPRPACAQWCDTDFVGTDGVNGGRYSALELRDTIFDVWHAPTRPFVVWTGGEPTLQWDDELGEAVSRYENAVETNGTTFKALAGMSWVTVSPKGDYDVVRKHGSELKLVFPQEQEGAQPKRFEVAAQLGTIDFDHYFLSPMEPVPLAADPAAHAEAWRENMHRAALYVLEHPFWRLSVQTHKWIGVP